VYSIASGKGLTRGEEKESFSIPIPSNYVEKTKSRPNQKENTMDEMNEKREREAKDVVRSIETVINRMGSRELQDEITSALANNHRTLQQNTMKFFMEFVAKMSQNRTDLRNEASVNLAKQIMAIPERDRILPYI
jgi:hypothetical protein